MKLLVSTIASVIVGAVAASATVVSLVNGSTGAPSSSPGDVSQEQITYGANQ